MKKILAALILSLIPAFACAGLFGSSDPMAEREWKVLSDVAADLHPKFTYVTDLEKWGEEHKVEDVTGDEAFSGDCEEFAIAAFTQALRRGVVTMTRPVKVAGVAHMITCGRYYCADNLHKGAFPAP